MDRHEFEAILLREYDAICDYPWKDDPTDEVFRHADTRKWFALVMELPRKRLGIGGDETVTAVNLKCDPRLIGTLRGRPGLYPAYHMNKEHWITATLDGSLPDEELLWLADMSYEITKAKKKPSSQK